NDGALAGADLTLAITDSDLQARSRFCFDELAKLFRRNERIHIAVDGLSDEGDGDVQMVIQVGGGQPQMAICRAPSQVFQHWQGCSLRHDKAEPFERRFELIRVDDTHRAKLLLWIQTPSRLLA